MASSLFKTKLPRGFTDLEQVLGRLNISIVKVADNEIVAHCPRHVRRIGKFDRRPSWSINRRTGEHNCYSCGYKGGLMLLVSDVLDVDSWEAEEWLKRQTVGLEGLKLALPEYEPERTTNRVKTYSEKSLDPFCTPPRRACKDRFITIEACRHYGIRWDDETDSWILPIREVDGRLRGYQIKSHKTRDFANHPPRVRKKDILFGSDVFPTGEAGILVESQLDVPRFFVAGIEGGLATAGLPVSRAQMKLALSLTDTLIVALDNDENGKLEARRLKEEYSKRLTLRFFYYGKARSTVKRGKRAKDPGEMSDEDLIDGVGKSVHSVFADI